MGGARCGLPLTPATATTPESNHQLKCVGELTVGCQSHRRSLNTAQQTTGVPRRRRQPPESSPERTAPWLVKSETPLYGHPMPTPKRQQHKGSKPGRAMRDEVERPRGGDPDNRNPTPWKVFDDTLGLRHLRWRSKTTTLTVIVHFAVFRLSTTSTSDGCALKIGRPLAGTSLRHFNNEPRWSNAEAEVSHTKHWRCPATVGPSRLPLLHGGDPAKHGDLRIWVPPRCPPLTFNMMRNLLHNGVVHFFTQREVCDFLCVRI